MVTRNHTQPADTQESDPTGGMRPLGAFLVQWAEKLFRLDGYGTLLIVLGVFVLLWTTMPTVKSDAPNVAVVTWVGAGMVAVGMLFALIRLFHMYKGVHAIQAQEQMLDAIQNSALSLSTMLLTTADIAAARVSLITPYVMKLQGMVTEAKQMLQSPRLTAGVTLADTVTSNGASQLVQKVDAGVKSVEDLMRDIDRTNALVHRTINDTRQVVENVRHAIADLDPKPIQAYAAQLLVLKGKMKALLAAPDGTPTKALPTD